MHAPLSIAVLGTGRMAEVHLAALARLRERNALQPPLRIGLYGRNTARVEELNHQHAVDFVMPDLEDALTRSDVDVVDNCLINALHYKPLMKAIRNGKHVLSEKPLAMTLAEARELYDTAASAGVVHGIIQNMRFEPGIAAAKKLVETGEVGRVFHIRTVFGYFVPPGVDNRPLWFYQADKAGGGIVHDMMAHFFDLYEWLIGPVVGVTCRASTAYGERYDASRSEKAGDVEDVAGCLVEFASGALGDAFMSWVRRKHEEVPYFELDGENASLRFSFHRIEIERAGETSAFRFDPTEEQHDKQSWQTLDIPHRNAFEVQFERFFEGLARGVPAEPHWGHGLRAMELLEAAYRSAATGNRIDSSNEAWAP